MTGVLGGTVLAGSLLAGALLASTVPPGIVLSLAPTLAAGLSGVALAYGRGRLTTGRGPRVGRLGGILTVLTRGRSPATR